MRCLNIRRVYDYLEGQLPPAQSAALESHLKECPRCRLLVEDRRRFLQAAGTLPELTLPDKFPLQVMARIKAAGASTASKWLWFGIGAVIPLSFALIGLVLVRFGTLNSWTGIIESLVKLFQQAAFTLLKGLKVVMVIIRTIVEFIGLALEKFGDLASLAPPETPFLATAVFILITAAFLLGISRKSHVGARK